MRFQYTQATIGETLDLYWSLLEQGEKAFTKRAYNILKAIKVAVVKENDFIFKLNVYAASYFIWKTTDNQEQREFYFRSYNIYLDELKTAICRQFDAETQKEYQHNNNIVYESLTILCLSYFVDHLYGDND